MNNEWIICPNCGETYRTQEIHTCYRITLRKTPKERFLELTEEKTKDGSKKNKRWPLYP